MHCIAALFVPQGQPMPTLPEPTALEYFDNVFLTPVDGGTFVTSEEVNVAWARVWAREFAFRDAAGTAYLINADTQPASQPLID